MPKGKGRMSALTEEEGQQEGNQEEWSQDVEWYGDEWDEYDWSQEWIGSLDDWSGDWFWSEDDWSWSDDWSWGPQDWWSVEQPSVNAPSGSQSTVNVPQDPTKNERTPNVAAVTVDTQDQNAARSSRTVRGAKPGMMTNLLVGACLLIGALSAGVPPVPSLKKGMMKEMNSMKEFDVYDEVLVKDCTEEQVNEALDCRCIKVWKNEIDLRCKVVVRGCFQNVEKNEEDNLFASTPSLVTMRLLLCMAMSRNWGITLGDVSTAFLHAPTSGEVYVWPPKEFYPNGDCLWKLKKAMDGLRQVPKLWQEHFADVMISHLGFRRCKSDPNLYCYESGKLYVLAYVDDLLVVGTDEMRKEFMSRLSEEVLLKETGQLVPGTEHTFLGRRLRHNGDSIDVRVSQTYIDAILDLYGVKNAKPVRRLVL